MHYVVGEEIAATFGDTEDLFPEGSLFMSLRAIGGASFRFRKERLPPRMATLHPPRCLPSICPSKKKENFAEQRQRREVYRTPYFFGGKEKNTDIDRERSEIIDRAKRRRTQQAVRTKAHTLLGERKKD